MQTYDSRLFALTGPWMRAVALLALFVLVSSCGAARLFKDDPVQAGGSVGKPVPPVAVQAVTGLPPTYLPELKAALARAGGDRDIGFVEGEADPTQFTLNGQFRTVPGTEGVRVLYQWQLRDASGVLLHTYGGEENAGLLKEGESWQSLTTAVMDRIAIATTESMAKRLKELGYATRHASVHAPPATYFAEAGAGAERDVDFETLEGPRTATAALAGLGPEGGLVPVEFEEPVQPGAEAQEAKAVLNEAKAEPAPSEGKTAIRAVAVLPVAGHDELTLAMRKTLAGAGWPVTATPRADALNIVGHVAISQPEGEQQRVLVRWQVQTPEGKSLGDVKQANKVQAGALDKGWGEAAFAVAEAAAMGIFDIIKTYR